MITAGEHSSCGAAPEHEDIHNIHAAGGVAEPVAPGAAADAPDSLEQADLVRASYGRQFGVALNPSYARAFADLPMPPDEAAQLIHALVLLARHAVQITKARAKQSTVGTPKHPSEAAAAAGHR
jgi:hypothetical protein